MHQWNGTEGPDINSYVIETVPQQQNTHPFQVHMEQLQNRIYPEPHAHTQTQQMLKNGNHARHVLRPQSNYIRNQ